MGWLQLGDSFPSSIRVLTTMRLQQEMLATPPLVALNSGETDRRKIPH